MPGMRARPLWAWFDLLRLALLPTALADSLAALFLAGRGDTPGVDAVVATILCTSGLWGFGMVLNDLQDARRDRLRGRPRPLAMGLLSVRSAAAALVVLGAIAGLAAVWLGPPSLIAAAITAGLITLYDTVSKHHALAGLLTLGLVRAAHAQLAVPLDPAALGLSAVLFCYVGCVCVAAYILERKRPRLGWPGRRWSIGMFWSVSILSTAWFAWNDPRVLTVAVPGGLLMAGLFWLLLSFRPVRLRGAAARGAWLIRHGLAALPVGHAVLLLARDRLGPAAVLLGLALAAQALLMARRRLGPGLHARDD